MKSFEMFRGIGMNRIVKYSLGIALTGRIFVSAAIGASVDNGASDVLQEITVTATRREEGLSKVPISVSAYTQETMDIKGIRDFADIARFTPGVTIDANQTNSISIRGISSSGGAGTTGIYIDDTPIQIRALGFNPDDTLPKTFDLDRVEVLRGPQGTLFGAGSEGGTVRYITTQPSLTQFTSYARSEVSYTEGGAASYEAGLAMGGPIINDTVGFRVSAWYRRDGGWIDQVDPTTLQTIDTNANHTESTAVRAALTWAPNSAVKITPSFFWQDGRRNDVDSYWPLYTNNAVMSRSAVLEFGAFDEDFETAEDNDLCYRWLKSGRRLDLCALAQTRVIGAPGCEAMRVRLDASPETSTAPEPLPLSAPW